MSVDDLSIKHINGGRALPKGSRPPLLEHQYLDANGNPYDLSTGIWTGQARAEQLHLGSGESQPTGIGSGSVSVTIATAIASYAWVDQDFLTPGRFRLIIWIGNGTQRFGSTIYEWDVADAPGADPTV